jgi:PAS domain S-box-containing protein
MMIFLNDAGKKMLGISEEEVAQNNLIKVIPEHLQNKVQQEVLPSIIKDGYWEGDLQYINVKTGGLTDVHAITFKIADPKTGTMEFFANVSLDITEQKQAEKALRESEEKYRLIFDYTPLGLLSFDEKGIIAACNDNYVKIIGSSREKLIGLNLLNLPDKNIVASVQKALNGSTGTYEDVYHSITANKITPVRAIFTPMDVGDGNIRGGVGIIEDITERMKAEKALQDSENRYRMISLLTTDYFFQVNIGENGSISLDMLSDNFPKITGRTQNDVVTPDLWDKIIHPDDIGRLKELMYLVISKGNDATLECRSFMQSGDQRWVQVVAHAVKSKENGKTTAIIGGVKDITERKNSESEIIEKNKDLASMNEELESTNEELAATNEELVSINEEFEASNEELIATNIELENATNELKKSKETIERYLNIAAEIILSQDFNGNITMLNESGHKLLGYKNGELIGRNLIETCLPEEARKRGRRVFNMIMNEEIDNVLTFDNKLITKNGEEKTIFWHNTLLRDDSGRITGTLSSGEDITEKQKLLETAQKHQKIESLGIMAGGIAHDFNNLLGGIYGFIDLARSTAKDPETKEYLDGTLNTMNRARGLTQQLLTFAKGGAPVRKIERLIPFIQETVQFALSGSNVSSSFDIPENLWLCNFDKNQIGQVIDNLVINAQQAMPMGGTIEVNAQNISFEGKKHPILLQKHYIKITVKDFGIGIPADILNRIFDPFFTTKVKGHGLGLATSYSIINRHEGIIDVESEIGKGSSFHVYLPAVKEEVSAKIEKKSLIQKGSGTIIVMDDEESIRNVLESMLKALGYTVILTKDGNEVMDIIKEEYKAKRIITGIILDLTVPGGMGGKKTILEIRKIDKNVPVFVSSGYAEDPIMSSPIEHGFTDSLCKPFMIADLADMLNKYLNRQ